MAVREALIPDEVPLARALFREYQRALGIDLCFQGFEAELASLPGAYAPPEGCLLLAEREGQVVGCVAVRPLESKVCELKRLFVRPEGRGLGLGRALLMEALRRAGAGGHTRIRLDTLATMVEALALYRSLGFREIPPYNHHPLPGTRFLELEIGGCGHQAGLATHAD